MLKPPQLIGEPLFVHMIKHQGRDVGTAKPSSYLGIDISDIQMSVIQPTDA